MANEQNLIPSNKGGYKFTREDRQKGGRASGEAKRRRREMKDLVKALLDLKLTAEQLADFDQLQTLASAKNANVTAKEAMAIALTVQAVEGDLKAVEKVLDIIGEAPKEDGNGANGAPVIILGGEAIRE